MYLDRADCGKSTFLYQQNELLCNSPSAGLDNCSPSQDYNLSSYGFTKDGELNYGLAGSLGCPSSHPEVSSQYFSNGNNSFPQKGVKSFGPNSGSSLKSLRSTNVSNILKRNKRLNTELKQKFLYMNEIFTAAERLRPKALEVSPKIINPCQIKKDTKLFLERLQKERVLKAEEPTSPGWKGFSDLVRERHISKNSLNNMMNRCKQIRKKEIRKKRLRKERTIRRLKKLEKKSKELKKKNLLKEKNSYKEITQTNYKNKNTSQPPRIHKILDDQDMKISNTCSNDEIVTKTLPNLEKFEYFHDKDFFSPLFSKELFRGDVTVSESEQNLLNYLDTDARLMVHKKSDSFDWKPQDWLKFSLMD